jgi:hypothetical protein
MCKVFTGVESPYPGTNVLRRKCPGSTIVTEGKKYKRKTGEKSDCWVNYGSTASSVYK